MENGEQNNTKAIISKDITPSGKDEYSACNKLIEKFQEAVIDTAVRIIQAYFKRFYERKRFLRLKKAVSVIQRSLRNWLQKRKFKRKSQVQRSSGSEIQLSASENDSKCIQAVTANCEISSEMTNYDHDSVALDIKVAQEDTQSIDEAIECCPSSCSCNSESNSECESDDEDGASDDDSDYGSGETECMCIVCGGWGCSPIMNESDAQSSKLLPNDLSVGQS